MKGLSFVNVERQPQTFVCIMTGLEWIVSQPQSVQLLHNHLHTQADLLQSQWSWFGAQTSKIEEFSIHAIGLIDVYPRLKAVPNEKQYGS